jgi:hypothetical protein
MAEYEMWRRCVDAARLAPSKHNAQPWWFEMTGGGVALHADGARATPASDPEGRELLIGCGAALFNLRLALRGEGRDPLVVLFPEGKGFSVVARVAAGGHRAPSLAEAAMLAAVPARHTTRGALDGQALAADVPFLLQDAAAAEDCALHLVTTPGARGALDRIVAMADRTLARDPGVEAELRAWTRTGGAEAVDGVPASAAGPGAAAAYRARFVERDFDVHGAVPSGRTGSMSTDDPMLAVLWTRGDGPLDWVRAGLALESVLLTVTVAGAAASLLNQPTEIPALRSAVRRELGLDGFPQAILRVGVGVGQAATATPRRPLDDVLTWP